MPDKPVIEERENGPLVVKGVTRMVGPDGAEVEVKPVMALCRCGGSQTKPFCDGSHNSNGFQSRGGEPAGKDKVYSFKGTAMTVLYNPLVCSHAAECVAMSPKGFDPDRRPWIDPDADDAAAFEAVVRACPSGALRIEGQDHLIPDRAQITIQPDGPYWVLDMEITADAPGEGATTAKKVLCRCGLSGNKPYCDGSHRDKGWRG
ncbi:MAG: CDGSH iron-sulfur domain-containing protein [Rhodobacter sp.]|nr:CDGSH iron-sulfur domain-containing protein [Rhodobacter sp.]